MKVIKKALVTDDEVRFKYDILLFITINYCLHKPIISHINYIDFFF